MRAVSASALCFACVACHVPAEHYIGLDGGQMAQDGAPGADAPDAVGALYLMAGSDIYYLPRYASGALGSATVAQSTGLPTIQAELTADQMALLVLTTDAAANGGRMDSYTIGSNGVLSLSDSLSLDCVPSRFAMSPDGNAFALACDSQDGGQAASIEVHSIATDTPGATVSVTSGLGGLANWTDVVTSSGSSGSGSSEFCVWAYGSGSGVYSFAYTGLGTMSQATMSNLIGPGSLATNAQTLFTVDSTAHIDSDALEAASCSPTAPYGSVAMSGSAAIDSPIRLLVDPSGQYIYAAGTSGTYAYAYDLNVAGLTVTTSSSIDLAIDPAAPEVLYVLENDAVAWFFVGAGTWTMGGSVSIGNVGPNAITLAP